jgi:hypothetical protein
MRQKIYLFRFLVIASLVFLIGCAGLKTGWDSLSKEEKARVVLNGAQDQLTAWFELGQNFVVANPKYIDEWKEKIVPGFDVANKAIRLAILQQYDISKVYAEVLPLVSTVIDALKAWGIGGEK